MTIEKLERPERLDEDRIEALKALFPSAVTDGRINFEVLRDELEGHTAEVGRDDQHYGLQWPGKRQAKKLAVMPPSGTLAPAPGEGVDELRTCS